MNITGVTYHYMIGVKTHNVIKPIPSTINQNKKLQLEGHRSLGRNHFFFLREVSIYCHVYQIKLAELLALRESVKETKIPYPDLTLPIVP